MTHANPIDANTALEKWLSACATNPWAQLTPRAAEPYAYIWKSWARYLGETHWTQATAIDVTAFINSIAQASRAKHAASDITRRRYWRVIDRVYEHGQLHNYCDRNPAQEVAECDRPPQENPEGATLSLRMWASLLKWLPTPSDAISARDRAVLMTLMELGVTSQELCNITLQDVAAHGLRISGERGHQNRTLATSAELSQALRDYIHHRPLLGNVANSDSLFVSREEPRMTAQAIQRITTKYMRAAAHRDSIPVPVKLGAQIIRNTSLLHRLLDGQPLRDVVALAGLKSPRSFTHLRAHLPQHLRAVVATSDLGSD